MASGVHEKFRLDIKGYGQVTGLLLPVPSGITEYTIVCSCGAQFSASELLDAEQEFMNHVISTNSHPYQPISSKQFSQGAKYEL